MEIQTKYHGKMKINPEKVIHFPSGIPGFIEEKKFVLLHLSEDSVFQTLQSLHTPDLAFIVTNPYHFYKDYEFKLDQNIREFLQIKRAEDVAVFSILTLREPFDKSTLNLKAPIIMNMKTNQAKQYVLNSPKYSIKTPLNSQALVRMKGDESC